MDHYHLSFKYEDRIKDRRRGWDIDQKLTDLLENASTIEKKPEIDGGLQGMMIGVRAIEEKTYLFGIEGKVTIANADALEFYGKAVYLKDFDHNNSTYLNLKKELESLGFKLNPDTTLELKNMGLKEGNELIKKLDKYAKK